VYTVSVILDGVVKSSVNVKTTTNNSRVDFDLKPAAEKIKHYVWVDAKTGIWEAVGPKWMTREMPSGSIQYSDRQRGVSA